MNQIITFTEEEKKIHRLFLTANFLKNPGIDGGKMGVVIYLLHQCRISPDHRYEDLAFELLEEVDSITDRLPFDGFRFGLCGIGWGYEYLIKNRYLEVESDPCASFEDKIWTGFRQKTWEGLAGITDLCGYLLFFLARIESSTMKVGSRKMQQYKNFILQSVNRLEVLLTVECISLLWEEKDNSQYGNVVPLVLSHWEYPRLLWILGRIRTHRLNEKKVECLLTRMMDRLLSQKRVPTKFNNRYLLSNVFQDLGKIDYSDLVLGRAIRVSLPSFLYMSEQEIDVRENSLGYN